MGTDHEEHPWKGLPSPTADFPIPLMCDGISDPLAVPISKETFELEAGGATFTTDQIEVHLI